MTGMSSLIGYTRLHVAHLSAVPFLTSVTGVLQLGHARISSSSGSTGMLGIYDTFQERVRENVNTIRTGGLRRRKTAGIRGSFRAKRGTRSSSGITWDGLMVFVE